MYLNLKNPLAFFDLETTGTNISQDRIVEIAIIKLMPNGEKLVKDLRINPLIPIPPEVTKIHGISDDDVKDAPPFKQVARELAKFLEGSDFAGFNIIRFDVPLLVEEAHSRLVHCREPVLRFASCLLEEGQGVIVLLVHQKPKGILVL